MGSMNRRSANMPVSTVDSWFPARSMVPTLEMPLKLPRPIRLIWLLLMYSRRRNLWQEFEFSCPFVVHSIAMAALLSSTTYTVIANLIPLKEFASRLLILLLLRWRTLKTPVRAKVLADIWGTSLWEMFNHSSLLRSYNTFKDALLKKGKEKKTKKRKHRKFTLKK